VTVHISTGLSKTFDVTSEPDTRTVAIDRYTVDVTTLVDQQGKCESSLSNFRKA
jgi:hypothetical protein